MNDCLSHKIIHLESIEIPHSGLKNTFLEGSLEAIHENYRLLPFGLESIGNILDLPVQIHAKGEGEV